MNNLEESFLEKTECNNTVNDEMEEISGGAASGTLNKGPRIQFVIKCPKCSYTKTIPGGTEGGDCPYCHLPLLLKDAYFPGVEAH